MPVRAAKVRDFAASGRIESGMSPVAAQLSYLTHPRSRRRWLVAMGVFFIIYFGTYFGLRVRGVIMHFKDMDGESVGPTIQTRWLVIFKPLMRAEELAIRLRRPQPR